MVDESRDSPKNKHIFYVDTKQEGKTIQFH